jgi:hypothetical protein
MLLGSSLALTSLFPQHGGEQCIKLSGCNHFLERDLFHAGVCIFFIPRAKTDRGDAGFASPVGPIG